MTEISLGQAIDQILKALGPLDDTSRKTALLAVQNQLNIKIETPILQDTTDVVKNIDSQIKDIRSLKEDKKPKNAQEMACLVAFYLSEIAMGDLKKETVNTDDLTKYFKQASFRLPKGIEQVLKNARYAGYFDTAARGEYKLNAVGYNLVAHQLPRKEA